MNMQKISDMFSSKKGATIYNKCCETIENYGMKSYLNAGVLVGFSGGPDSCMLLSFLLEYRKREKIDFQIVCCHINHMIRGQEANRDEKFAKTFAKELNVEFVSHKIDVPSLAKEEKQGIEETARNVRYSKFQEILLSRNDLKCICVAHNADDNVETVLLNALRGSGLRGMCGIAPVRDNILRPLISVCKNDIVSCLDENSIEYVFDSTNGDDTYNRNHLRLNVIPQFSKIVNDPINSFSKMCENLRVDLDFIENESKKAYLEIKKNRLTNDVLRNLNPSIFFRVMSLIFEEFNIPKQEEKHIKELYRLLQNSNFEFSLIGDYNFVCQRNLCFFELKNKNSLKLFKKLEIGLNKLDNFGAYIEVSQNKYKTYSNVYNFSIQVELSSAIIKGGLYVRLKNNGDSYKYGNMTHKLKKVFNDRNIPPAERDLIPIVCDDDGIVWVPGLPIKDSYNIEKDKIYLTFYIDELSNESKLYTAQLRK